MGVPLPHLVLPLSGCLSRHTPTRATRGEARGHRSVLAQNPLLMYPSFFLSLDFSSAWCVLPRWWIGPHCLCAAVGTSLSGVGRSRYFVDMWVAAGHTARLRGCVCGNRCRRTHNGYPRGLVRVGWMRVRFGGIPWCICVVAVIGLCDRWLGTAPRHTQ